MALTQTSQILLYFIAAASIAFAFFRLYRLDKQYFVLSNDLIHISSRVHTDKKAFNQVKQQITSARLEAWFFVMVILVMLSLAITVFIIS